MEGIAVFGKLELLMEQGLGAKTDMHPFLFLILLKRSQRCLHYSQPAFFVVHGKAQRLQDIMFSSIEKVFVSLNLADFGFLGLEPFHDRLDTVAEVCCS